MAKPYYRAETFEGRKSLGYLIRRLHNLTMPRAEALFADAEFTFSHWVTLMALRDGIATTCAGIARHLDHDTGATTRLVDQLEKRGLLTRTRNTDDRRVVDLKLTAEGVAIAAELMPRITDFWNDVLDDFSHAEATSLIALMTKLMDALEATPVAGPKKREAAQ
ncbi:MAG: MarR family transcriptional regulator [Rhizomicrobium sp.]